MVEVSGGQIGPFEIIAPIGSGGFATVYKALDTRFDSHVALKILADNHALNPEMRERFITEAQTLRRIGAPTTLAVYDIGETSDRRPYLVLELAVRGNLVTRRAELLANGWQASTNDASALVDALGTALAVVHRHGLIHRDVAPSNILIRSGCDPHATADRSIVRSDEQLVVADLGLVKDLAAGSGLTTGGGTVGFSPPEQRAPFGLVDARTDVYAASAVVRWLLSPGGAEVTADWATDLRANSWPGDFVDGLERGLADEVTDRHDSIERWREDLDRGLGGRGRLTAQHRAASTVARRNGWQKVLAGSIAVAAVGTAGFVVGNRATATSTVADPLVLLAPPATPEPAATEVATAAPLPPGPSATAAPEATEVATAAPVPAEPRATAAPEATEVATVAPVPAEPRATAAPVATAAATPEPVPDEVAPQTVIAGEVDLDAPVPQPNFAVVRFVDQQNWRLVVGWGDNPSDSVAVTELQVAVDGGPWLFEVLDGVPVAAAWELWSTGDPDDRSPVRTDASYSVRVRWRLTNGDVTNWSESLVSTLEP